MLKTLGNPSTRNGDQTIVNGNLVIGTAGNGIAFFADGQSAGMTSELLDDYEEGTWTPNFSTWTTGPTNTSGTYTKIGRQVTVIFGGNGGVIGDTGQTVANLPFTSAIGGVCAIRDASGGSAATTGTVGYSAVTMSSFTPVSFAGLWWTGQATYFV
jgi:hypothetical protein